MRQVNGPHQDIDAVLRSRLPQPRRSMKNTLQIFALREPCPECGGPNTLADHVRDEWFCADSRECGAKGKILADGYLAVTERIARVKP